MSQLIAPHGGHLVQTELSGEEREEAGRRIAPHKRIAVDGTVRSDLLLLATGAYSPLKGFMEQDDYTSVLEHMRLRSGILWSLPIMLPVDKQTAKTLKEGEEIGLTDESGSLLGVLYLNQKYEYDKWKEARLVYQTTDENHPGVARLFSRGEVLLGGGGNPSQESRRNIARSIPGP